MKIRIDTKTKIVELKTYREIFVNGKSLMTIDLENWQDIISINGNSGFRKELINNLFPESDSSFPMTMEIHRG